MSSLVNGSTGFALAGAGIVPSFLARTAVSMGLIEFQNRVIYHNLLTNNADERGSSIADFDRIYFFARLPWAHYSDKFIRYELPVRLYNACMKGSRLNLIFSPGMVRIYERSGSALRRLDSSHEGRRRSLFPAVLPAVAAEHDW